MQQRLALATLGEREPGTERLEQALAAFTEALKERTRERVPLDWATTQSNLGAALVSLGERESGTERLEQAVAAYTEALKERTRERVPLDWAATQSNVLFPRNTSTPPARPSRPPSGSRWREESEVRSTQGWPLGAPIHRRAVASRPGPRRSIPRRLPRRAAAAGSGCRPKTVPIWRMAGARPLARGPA